MVPLQISWALTATQSELRHPLAFDRGDGVIRVGDNL